VELGFAAEMLSNTMNAFKRSLTDPTVAANALAGAASASSSDLQSLGYALASVGAVSSGVGLNLEDTLAAVAQLSNNGLGGSDAGTSLKTMLSLLQPTTKEASKLFEQFELLNKNGSSKFFDETTGKIKSMAQIAELLHTKFGGLRDDAKQKVLNDLFGSDGIRAALILAQDGAKGIKDMQDAMKTTTAQNMATTMSSNTEGAIKKMGAAWDMAKNDVFSRFLDPLKGAFDWLATSGVAFLTGQMHEMGNTLSRAASPEEWAQLGKDIFFGVVDAFTG
jgi:TP901 family phage tail tape measure protein